VTARALLAAATLLLFPFVAGSCFKTPTPACAFRCGPAGECPPDYLCNNDDGQCHHVVGGEFEQCAPLVSTPDASVPEPDAAPAIDAAEPDAAPPIDAAEPDAAPAIDAPAPDA
jgi:hypothetical protein